MKNLYNILLSFFNNHLLFIDLNYFPTEHNDCYFILKDLVDFDIVYTQFLKLNIKLQRIT